MINTTLIVTNIPYIIMALGVFFGLIFTWLACRGQGSTDEVSTGVGISLLLIRLPEGFLNDLLTGCQLAPLDRFGGL